jgi:tRNA-2-methylthio-N6-dimethylallyladenosine synthase
MTGFPGETPRDFEDTLSLFRQTRFTAAFMFAFSPRPGTAAASFPDQVPAAVGRERLAELIALQTATTQEHYAAMVGREVNALITGRLPKRERPWIGQDHGCKRVLVACDGDLAGTILPLTVASATGMSLIAERGAPCAS